jgi:hypothetical protein
VDSRRQPLCLAKPCVSRRPVFIDLTEEELELWLAPIVYLEFYNSLHGFLSFGGPHMVIDEQVLMPRKFNSAASAPPFLSWPRLDSWPRPVWFMLAREGNFACIKY